MLIFFIVLLYLLIGVCLLLTRARTAKLDSRIAQLERRVADLYSRPAPKADPHVSQYLQQWQHALAESQTQQHTDLKAALTDFTDGLASVRSMISLLSNFRNDLSLKQSALVERETAVSDREKAFIQAEMAAEAPKPKPGGNNTLKHRH